MADIGIELTGLDWFTVLHWNGWLADWPRQDVSGRELIGSDGNGLVYYTGMDVSGTEHR